MKNSNPVNWFEIPVIDMQRAKMFYSNVLEVEMMDMPPMGDDTEMVAFPWEEGATNASGALFKSPDAEPSDAGARLYFHCEDLNSELSRVEQNGGKILVPKTSIGEHGFFATILDSEGNKVALHSSPS